MDITQSFVMTMARARLTMYQQRILVKIVEHGQELIKGMPMSLNLKKLEHDLDNVKLVVPVRYILSDGTDHYEHVYEAARGLMQKVFEVYDSTRRVWYATPYIYNVTVARRTGNLTFYVSRAFFDTLYDFTKGYSKYVLETAMALKSPYSVRMYILMSGQRHDVTYTVDFLKSTFGVENLYTQTADFIKRVIEPARKELTDFGCDTFTYQRIKHGSKVTALQFTPKKVHQDTKEQLLARVGLSSIIQRDIYIFLTTHCGFTYRELSAHKVLLEKLARRPDANELLLMIEHRFRKGNKTKGYIIAALKSELQTLPPVK